MIQGFSVCSEKPKDKKKVPKLVVQGQWIAKDDCRFNSSNQLQLSWIILAIQYSKLQRAESSGWNLILFDKWDHHLSYTEIIHLGKAEGRHVKNKEGPPKNAKLYKSDFLKIILE